MADPSFDTERFVGLPGSTTPTIDYGNEIHPGKLFIGGLSWDTTDEGLKAYFEKFGPVLEATIMRDRYTGRSRGFGFVFFENEAACDQVADATHVIDGRPIEAKKAVPRDVMMARDLKTKKIFVGGLTFSTTEDELRQYFGQFGTVTEAQIMLERDTARPRGFGFVTFDNEDTVEKVIARPHELNSKPIDVKKAEPKRTFAPPFYGRGYYGGGAYGGYGGYGGGGGGYSGGYGDFPPGGNAYGRSPASNYGSDPYAQSSYGSPSGGYAAGNGGYRGTASPAYGSGYGSGAYPSYGQGFSQSGAYPSYEGGSFYGYSSQSSGPTPYSYSSPPQPFPPQPAFQGSPTAYGYASRPTTRQERYHPYRS